MSVFRSRLIFLALLAGCAAPRLGSDAGVADEARFPVAAADPAVGTGGHVAGNEAASLRYRVLCHFDCGELAEQALRVAEAALPHAVRVYGEAATPARPLEIHLYRTAAEYRAARSGLLRRAPRPLAVTEPSSRTAHIALRSSIADTTLLRVGLPPNILRVVAHEAFHLASLAIDTRVSRLPTWFNEGAASWAEQEVLRAAGVHVVSGSEPVFETYLWLLQRRAMNGTLPALDAILTDDLRVLDEQERYAVRQLLFTQLLNTYPGRLPAYVADALAVSPRGDGTARALHAHLLPDARLAAALEGAMHDAALSARPAWAQASRSLDLLSDALWLQIGLSGDAEAWRIRYATSVRLSGAVEPLTGGVARVLVGTAQPGNLIIEMDFDRAEARLWRSGDDAPIARAAMSVFRGEVPFQLDAAAGSVSLRAGGATFAVDLDDATPNGMWGLGAAEGTNVLWHGVAIGP